MGSNADAEPKTKKFMFLTIGFKKPSPEQMAEWGNWFKSLGERMLEQGGFWSGGREFGPDSSTELPFGPDSITGYVIFTADSKDEAEELAQKCPVVASNRIYEIMTN